MPQENVNWILQYLVIYIQDEWGYDDIEIGKLQSPVFSLLNFENELWKYAVNQTRIMHFLIVYA